MSNDQIATRRKQELKVEFKDVQPPNYLSAKLKKEFIELADKLVKIGIMTELDEDLLAMCLIAKDEYLDYGKMLRKAKRDKEPLEKLERITRMQSKAYNQWLSAARETGLTIQSRLRLVVPEIEEPKQNKFTKKFGGGVGG